MTQVKKIKCTSEMVAILSAYDLETATLEDMARLGQLQAEAEVSAQWEECSEQDAAWYEKIGFEVRR